MSWRDRIEINPEVMMGKPVIRGTRITVELIVQKMDENPDPLDMVLAYPQLTLSDIIAAILWAVHE